MRDVIGVARFEEIAPYIAKALAGDESIFELNRTRRMARSDTSATILFRNGRGLLWWGCMPWHSTSPTFANRMRAFVVLRKDSRLCGKMSGRSVATMLHDGIAQDLFAARLEVDAMAAAHPKDFPQLCRALSTALTRCMDDTRQLTHSLHPVALSRYGVGAAIVRHARYFTEQSQTCHHCQLQRPVTAAVRCGTIVIVPRSTGGAY